MLWPIHGSYSGTMRKHQGQLSTRCSTLQTQMQIGAKEVPGVVELQSDADVVKQRYPSPFY